MRVAAFGICGIVAVLSCFGSAAAELTGQGAWAHDPPLPLDRTELGVVALDGKIYAAGGFAADTDAVKLFQVYDPNTHEWHNLAPLPKPVSHPGLIALGGKIYSVGGFTENVHVGAVDYFFQFDPNTNAWTVLSPLPSPRGSVGVASANGELHAIGGRNVARMTVAEHDVYDPKSGRWREAAALPLARDHAGVISVGDQIHVIGGRTNSATDLVGRHDVYDWRTDTWHQAAPLPTPRSSGAIVSYQGRILYVGGECKDPRQQRAFSENEGYDPLTDHWQSLTPLPQTGRHAFGSAAVGSVAYFIGGAQGCGGNGPSADVLTFHLP